ncbi:hypothetical protein ABZ579_22280, partial [Streptomyces thermolilacinus]
MTATTDGSVGTAGPATTATAELHDTATTTPAPGTAPAATATATASGSATATATAVAPGTASTATVTAPGQASAATVTAPGQASAATVTAPGTASAATVTEPAVGTDLATAARTAMRRSVDHLLARQDAEGWWKGDLETNVTMDAEDLLLRQFLGIRDDATTEAAALFIRGEQRDDGTWATFHGGPGELSTTIEAYVALRLAGDPPDAPHMARAAAWVRDRGGIAAARVFTRMWLALFGWWKWDDLPELPPE